MWLKIAANNFFQVFDLGEKAPDKVLHQLYVTLGTLKYSGDILATEIEKRLRIIVSWIFNCFLPQFPYTLMHA